MATTPATFPTDDIYLSAWLELQGNPASLVLNGKRVQFLHNGDKSLFPLITKFNDESTSVPLGRYISVLKKLRGQMVAMRPAQYPNAGRQ